MDLFLLVQISNWFTKIMKTVKNIIKKFIAFVQKVLKNWELLYFLLYLYIFYVYVIFFNKYLLISFFDKYKFINYSINIIIIGFFNDFFFLSLKKFNVPLNYYSELVIILIQFFPIFLNLFQRSLQKIEIGTYFLISVHTYWKDVILFSQNSKTIQNLKSCYKKLHIILSFWIRKQHKNADCLHQNKLQIKNYFF